MGANILSVPVLLLFSVSVALAPPTFAVGSFPGRDQSQRLVFVEGYITSVEASAQTVTVQPFSGDSPAIVHVTEESHLQTRRGRGLVFDELRAGLEVRVRGVRLPESTAEQLHLHANLLIIQEVSSLSPLPTARKLGQVFVGVIESVRGASLTVRGKYGHQPLGPEVTASFRFTDRTSTTVSYSSVGADQLTLVGKRVRIRVDRGTALTVQVGE